MSSNLACPHRWGRLLLPMLLLMGAVPSAYAQSGHGHGGRQKTQQPAPSPSPTATSPTTDTPSGPRLEVGALFCQSHDDLVEYQTLVAGETSPKPGDQPPKCHRLEKQVGIQILNRDGPSRTQIVTTEEPKQTGWTNAYLP